MAMVPCRRSELLARVQENQAKRAEKYVAHMIERHDENGDGMLSMDEMKSRNKGKMFSRMDANDDGVVTKEEFDEMRARHKHRKHKKKHENYAD